MHLGHAFAAITAHDMVRASGGRFLLRIEDTDLERSKPVWDAQIRQDLIWLGLTWDGPVLRQSQHLTRYDTTLRGLADKGLLYPCSCSRADIRAALAAPQEGLPHQVYPGTCRHRPLGDAQPGDALRLDLHRALDTLVPSQLVFQETGPTHKGTHAIARTQALEEIGDIVLRRKGDGIVAYFLASALDDAYQQITTVVRGEDLFSFTAIQVILLILLGHKVPAYHHHRLIRDEAGKRLAKRDDARAIAKYRADGATPQDIRNLIGLAL